MGIRILDNNLRAEAAVRNRPSIVQRVRQNTTSKFHIVRFTLVMLDVLMVTFAFWAAYNIRFVATTNALFNIGESVDMFYQATVFVLIPLWVLLFYLFKAYDPAILFSGHQEYSNVFNACMVGIMAVIVVIFLDTSLTVARGWLLLAWIFSMIFVGTGRLIFRRWVYLARRRGHFMTPTYIVGANQEGIAIAEHLMSAPQFGINVIGFLDDEHRMGEAVMPDVIVHGSTKEAEVLCRKFGVERMIVATSGIERKSLQNMFKRFVNVDDVSVWLSSGMYEMLTTGVRVHDIGSTAMIDVNRVRLNGINIVLKAVMDYVGAVVGIVLLLPVFAIIIALMQRFDPGPMIYRRRVLGVGGNQFDAFKFRTMIVNADDVLQDYLESNDQAREEWAKYGKLKDDPRVTWLGKVLRRTSLDELPQLFNVLKGQMSLVGPRMITPEEVERYGQWNMNIHTVKPGITGLWQISGRNEVDYDERVRLDMHYIRNYSFWLDLQILFWTVPTVLFRKGAY